ncbi:MAG: hypothetical protein NXI20_03045 [bacterium]|nr:hypothetical protein [bacterium]
MKRLLNVLIIITLLVWSANFFGYGGTIHTFIVMGLIILCLIITFILVAEGDIL